MTSVQDALQRNPPQALVLADSRRTHVRHLLCHSGSDPLRTGWRHFLMKAIEICPVTWAFDTGHTGLHVALGITWPGMLMRGDLPGHVRRIVYENAPAFFDGSRLRAAQRLGDTGASAAQRWSPDFDARTLLGVLTLAHDDEAVLDAAEHRLRDAAAGSGGTDVVVHSRRGGHLGAPPGEQGQWVHFGFRDGLSHVALRGVGKPGDPADTVSAGEALLGLPRESGDNPWQLAGRPERTRQLFRHGSFGVLREVEQDIPAFEDFVTRMVDALKHAWPPHTPQPSDWRGYAKSRLCGRWPDGRISLGPIHTEPAGDPDAPPPRVAPAADSHGQACPFGAHAQRLNPRPGIDPQTAVVHARRRVLLRRSRPYGSADWQGADRAEPREPRGLLGHFFCASLEDQFEQLLGLWADAVPLGVPDGGDAKDPLIGGHEDPTAHYEVPLANGKAVQVRGLQPFVTTRGTAYAFYPSRDGLQQLLRDRDHLDPDDEDYLP